MSSPPLKQIIHLDMDAFYAAVEQHDNPELRGQPVIVGGREGRGVVSTASYEARVFGVHSAMPISTALRLCPHGFYISPRMWRYQEISNHIMDIFTRYTPLVEPLSLDEAFLDVSGSIKLFGQAPEIAKHIKNDVKQETGLTISAGVATQKHLAKIASGMNKPDGLTIVAPGDELDFLWPLSLNNLWGVGKVTLKNLQSLGLKTIGELAALERQFLVKRFGQFGAHLWDLANGIDPRMVEPLMEAKSIGTEQTFPKDLSTHEDIKAALLSLTLEAAGRLREQHLKAKTITVKFRDEKFNTTTRAKTLDEATDLREALYKTVLEIYDKRKNSLPPMRLLGVTFSGLVDEDAETYKPRQRSLFENFSEASNSAEPYDKSSRINKALDDLQGRFGKKSILPASLISHIKTKK